jgi:hypothetical protein
MGIRSLLLFCILIVFVSLLFATLYNLIRISPNHRNRPDDNFKDDNGDNSKVFRTQDFVIGTDSKQLLWFLQVSFVNIHLFFKLMNFVCIFFRLLIYTLAYFMMLTELQSFDNFVMRP